MAQRIFLLTQVARTSGTASVLAAATLALSLGLGGCGLGVDSDKLYAEAQQAVQRGDLRAAEVGLKSILQDQPDNIEARRLLGEVELQSRDGFAAERDFRRLLELGVPMEEVAAPLGEAMLLQGLFEPVLDEIHIGLARDDASKSAILRLRGDAKLGLGAPGEARDLYEQALELDRDNLDARLGVARSWLAQDERQKAAAVLDEIIGVAPDYLDGLLVRGRLNFQSGMLEEAAQDFEKAANLAKARQNVPLESAALSALGDTQLAEGNMEGAGDSLARLEAIAPSGLMTHYLSARLAIASQEYEHAEDHLQIILAEMPDNRPAQMMYGLVNLVQRNYAQAEMYLQSVVSAEPGNARARQLLAQARLGMDRPEEALEALQPVVASGSAGSATLASAGAASFRAGQTGAALELLGRAAAADPGNLGMQLQLALAHLVAGNPGEALRILDAMPDDASFARARQMSRIMAQHRDGDVTGASGRLDAMLAGEPDSPDLWMLKGVLLQDSNRWPEAVEAFGRAAELAPGDRAAQANLAQALTAAGKLEQAGALYASLLERDRNDTLAMWGMARVASEQGDMATAVGWLEKARSADARALQPRVVLARYYQQLGDVGKAAKLVEEAAALAPSSAAVKYLSGMQSLQQGNAEAAERDFRAAYGKAPEVADHGLYLASTLAARGRSDEALEVVRQNLSDHPDHVPSRSLYGVLLATREDYASALDVAGGLKKDHADNAVGWVLEGDVLRRMGQHAKAAQSYDRALSLKPMRHVAIKAADSRRQAGLARPWEPLAEYVAASPDDAPAIWDLALAYQQAGRGQDAIAAYEQLVARYPDNANVLNNLAWLYQEQADPRAEQTARRAHELAPSRAEIADTYGWVLFNAGKKQEAAVVLREASKLRPQDKVIRYHLAAALADTGSGFEAKQILSEILASGERFEAEAEARALLGRL